VVPLTFSWQRYDGLSLNSQTSVSTQLLLRKYHVGFEVQPTPRSAWAGMINLAPKPDALTMQALEVAFYELKDGMPARDNFWSALLPIAAQGLATFGSSLLQKILGGSENKSVVNETNASQVRQPRSVKRVQINNKQSSREKDMERKITSLTKKIDSMSVRQQSRPRSRSSSQKSRRSLSRRRNAIAVPRKRTPVPTPRKRRVAV